MPDFPHVIPDLRHRSLTVILRDADVVGTLELDDAHLVDVDADGRAVSIEVLTLDDMKIEEMGTEFGFRDEVAAIREAIERVMAPTATTGAADITVVYGVASILIETEAETGATEPPLVPPIVV